MQDRLRKATEENKELAATLRREAEAASRKTKSSKKKGTSDPNSIHGSEDRQSSASARGTKRGRDSEIEKVSHEFFLTLHQSTSA